MGASGLVCLQGGHEFTPGCREMDRALLERAPGPVAVLPLASPPGAAYRRTGEQGVRHFRALGVEAYVVPDPREVPLSSLDGVGLVVLPGGSPSTLVGSLADTAVGELVVQHAAVGAVMGASAGAMVLGERLVLPDDGLRVVAGLGLAPGMAVVPHWDGPRDDWLKALTCAVDSAVDNAVDTVNTVAIVGIPEESGILLEHGQVTAVGRRSSHLVSEGREVRVGHTIEGR